MCALKRLPTVISTSWFQSLLLCLCCFCQKVLHKLNLKSSVSLKGSCLCNFWIKKEKGVSRNNKMKETNRTIVTRAFYCILSVLCGSSIFPCFRLRYSPAFDLSLPSIFPYFRLLLHLRNLKIPRRCAFILCRLRFDEHERKREVQQKKYRSRAKKMTD
jgi:hypothetical protein